MYIQYTYILYIKYTHISYAHTPHSVNTYILYYIYNRRKNNFRQLEEELGSSTASAR